jgi:hypothetical protein
MMLQRERVRVPILAAIAALAIGPEMVLGSGLVLAQSCKGMTSAPSSRLTPTRSSSERTVPGMSRLSGALIGALLLGGIGFVGGFFGPVVVSPESNQGPLLGIFITGPIGFVIGGILGAIFGPSIGRRASP